VDELCELCKSKGPLCDALVQGRGSYCPYQEGPICCTAALCPLTQEVAYPRKPRWSILQLADSTWYQKAKHCPLVKSVETLATEYLQRGKVQAPPIPVELVALFDTQRKVELRPVSLKVYHGAIWPMGSSWIIHVNERDSHQTKRYTIFHEAFHIACRSTCPQFKQVSLGFKLFSELLADYFAACILMPKEWVQEQWPQVKDVRKMACIFDVPVPAMWMRLKQLGLLANE
jgi:hypothetical protein